MSEKSVKHVALISLFAVALRVGAGTVFTQDHETDWGLHSQHLLDAHAEQLFGVEPVEENALGPYSGLDSALSVIAGKGLKVSVVSNATHRLNDMIALWPNDDHPTHLFILSPRQVCAHLALCPDTHRPFEPGSEIRRSSSGRLVGNHCKELPPGCGGARGSNGSRARHS